MKEYIGIDLGTSALKALLIDENGDIVSQASRTYPIYQDGVKSEQNPNDWYNALLSVLDELLLNKSNKEDVHAISFSGQMHGLVALDSNDEPLMNCILWNDGRSIKECNYLNFEVEAQKYTANYAYPGFTAPKIMWVYENMPDVFEKINKIMLPKDYLVYKITNNFVTDYSDASGMLLLDVENKAYSKGMLEVCKINEEMLPKLYESYECVGMTNDLFNKRYGIDGIKVIIGGADNALAAIGTNTINEGDCNISLGTSGTLLIPSKDFKCDKDHLLHSFISSTGEYYLMGCLLSAASCRMWWLNDVLHADFASDEIQMKDAYNPDLYFMPFLNGERTVGNEANIKGSFIGLTSSTTKAMMSRSIIEGVSFMIKEYLDIAVENNITINRVTVCGGGTKSRLWLQVLADILNKDLYILENEQGPAFGAAMLAMIGDGHDFNVLSNVVSYKEVIKPTNSYDYTSKYNKFRKLHATLKEIYR